MLAITEWVWSCGSRLREVSWRNIVQQKSYINVTRNLLFYCIFSIQQQSPINSVIIQKADAFQPKRSSAHISVRRSGHEHGDRPG